MPKCLVPIHGRALLDYWLDILFASAVIDRVLINTHYLHRVVEEHVATSAWRDRIDLVHESELLGTGGTLKANRRYFGDEALLLAHADNLTELDLDWFLDAHANRPAHCLLTMLAFETDDPRSCGILELDASSVVQAFHEKVENPPGNLANAAVYVLTPEVADHVAGQPGDFVDFSTQVIPDYVGRIFAVKARGYHRDIGNVESLSRAQAEFIPGAQHHHG